MDNKLVYYTLIWNSKKDYTVNITSNKLLDDEYYMNDVTLRKSKFNIKVYGKIKDNNTDIINNNSGSKQLLNVPLLKSNLQKCIRRGLVDKALITGYNLILRDFWSFIRRIIIISIEDVSVLENVPFLSWCLLAYPNFNITNEIIQYLLLTIFSLCTFKKKIKIKIDKTYAANIGDVYDDLIVDPIKFGYLIRMEFGGLKGDMAMIKTLLYKDIKNRYIVRVPMKNLIITRSISKLDIINPSIDFHISNKILEYVSSRGTIKNHDIIKKAIWNHSSSINYREKEKDKSLKEEWNTIKIILEDFYRNFKIY